jgi:hypothetical protein
MSPLRLAMLIPVVAFLGCGKGTSRFDSRTRAILAGATRVEVFRIDGNDTPGRLKPKQEGGRSIGGFRVLSQGADQAQPFAAKLADILLDNETYTETWAACYMPGVALRVWKDEDHADVLICFKCQNLYCGPPIQRATENASFAGSPAESRLIRLAKEAFPDDEQIQALKEK